MVAYAGCCYLHDMFMPAHKRVVRARIHVHVCVQGEGHAVPYRFSESKQWWSEPLAWKFRVFSSDTQLGCLKLEYLSVKVECVHVRQRSILKANCVKSQKKSLGLCFVHTESSQLAGMLYIFSP